MRESSNLSPSKGFSWEINLPQRIKPLPLRLRPPVSAVFLKGEDLLKWVQSTLSFKEMQEILPIRTEDGYYVLFTKGKEGLFYGFYSKAFYELFPGIFMEADYGFLPPFPTQEVFRKSLAIPKTAKLAFIEVSFPHTVSITFFDSLPFSPLSEWVFPHLENVKKLKPLEIHLIHSVFSWETKEKTKSAHILHRKERKNVEERSVKREEKKQRDMPEMPEASSVKVVVEDSEIATDEEEPQGTFLEELIQKALSREERSGEAWFALFKLLKDSRPQDAVICLVNAVWENPEFLEKVLEFENFLKENSPLLYVISINDQNTIQKKVSNYFSLPENSFIPVNLKLFWLGVEAIARENSDYLLAVRAYESMWAAIKFSGLRKGIDLPDFISEYSWKDTKPTENPRRKTLKNLVKEALQSKNCHPPGPSLFRFWQLYGEKRKRQEGNILSFLLKKHAPSASEEKIKHTIKEKLLEPRERWKALAHFSEDIGKYSSLFLYSLTLDLGNLAEKESGQIIAKDTFSSLFIIVVKELLRRGEMALLENLERYTYQLAQEVFREQYFYFYYFRLMSLISTVRVLTLKFRNIAKEARDTLEKIFSFPIFPGDVKDAVRDFLQFTTFLPEDLAMEMADLLLRKIVENPRNWPHHIVCDALHLLHYFLTKRATNFYHETFLAEELYSLKRRSEAFVREIKNADPLFSQRL